MAINTDNMIFVFGSNLGGIHGAGAAAFAKNHRGASWGVGVGFRGQSYAIPTKGIECSVGMNPPKVGSTLPLETIKVFVEQFIDFAEECPELQFQVTRIGCGLAGLNDWDIAPMFDGAPDNCWFDQAWNGHIGIRSDRIWGTF